MHILRYIITLHVMILSLSSYSCAHYDREFEKMKFAQECAQNGSHGFQGCANQQICGNKGFYLAQYSPEGLCRNCEFEQSPERFVACIFCRAPYKKLSEDTLSECYGMCDHFIGKILVKSSKPDDADWRQEWMLSIGAHKLLNELKSKLGRGYILAFGIDKIKFAAQEAAEKQRRASKGGKFEFERLGIYLDALILANGNKLHTWTDTLTIDPADKRTFVDENDAKEHLAYICRKYNVFGPETGEITLTSIPADAVTFEEIVSRS